MFTSRGQREKYNYMVTMMQWWRIEENKAKITNNLRDKHESISINGMEGVNKDKKRKSWRELMEEERYHAT